MVNAMTAAVLAMGTTVGVLLPSAGLAPSETQPVSWTSWEIETGDGFGFVGTIARCGDLVLLADVRRGVVHRYDLAGQQSLAVFGPAVVGQLMGIVPDCPAGTLYVFSVTPDGTGSVAKQIDLDTGTQSTEYPLPANFLPRSAAWIEPGSIFIGGLWGLPGSDDTARTYYEGRLLGVRLLTATGVTEPVLTPYELACIGGPACTLAMAVSLVRAHQLPVISNGLLLGGVFTMIYGVGWIIATDTSVARFAVMTVAFVLTLALGYVRFVRRQAVSALPGGRSIGDGEGLADIEQRVRQLEERMNDAANALGHKSDRSQLP